MKRLLLLCTIFAGVLAFTGYGEDAPQKPAEQVPITGFGGFTLGAKLNPAAINQQAREKGFIFCKAKTQFRNFGKIQLFFTPKTLIIYQINARAEGNFEDLAIVRASFEKKYNQKMERVYGGFSITIGDRIVKIGRALRNEENFISVADLKLAEQARKEKEECAQEQINTTGL